jgi:hypothetical protein
MKSVKGDLKDESRPIEARRARCANREAGMRKTLEAALSVLGVLLDKDGTLIDFHETWGPATHAVIHALAAGDPELMRAQAEILHFSLGEKRFRPTSPLIAGSSASYGRSWGESLGRTDFAALKREIDHLTAVESLKALTPIGDLASAPTTPSKARGGRSRRSVSKRRSNSSPATIPAMAANPIPAWCWRSRAISASRRQR